MTSNAGWRDYWKADRPASCMPENERTAQEIAATWQKWFAECAGGSRILDIATGNGIVLTHAAAAGRQLNRAFALTGVDLADIDPLRYLTSLEDDMRAATFIGSSRSGTPAVRGRQLRRGGLAIRTGVCGSRPGVGRGRTRTRARRNAALAGAQRKQRSRAAESRAGARSRISARAARTCPLHEYVRGATASPQGHAVLDGDAQRELRARLRVVQSPSAGESRAGDVQRLRRHRQPLAGLRSRRSGEDAGGLRASADVAQRSHPQPPRCGDDAATSPVAAGHSSRSRRGRT